MSKGYSSLSVIINYWFWTLVSVWECCSNPVTSPFVIDSNTTRRLLSSEIEIVQGYYFLKKFLSIEKWNTAISTLQCWSEKGKWINESDGIAYYFEDFDTKVNWPAASKVCFNYYYQYRTMTNPTNLSWITDSDDICPRSYHHQWSKERFCRAFGGHNILIVGDSINIQLYQTLLLMTTKDTSRVSIDCSVELQGASTSEIVKTNVHYYSLDDWKVNQDRIPISLNVSVLIYNRGIHYVEDNMFLKHLSEMFDFVKNKYPNISIIFRNTPVGHPGCETQFASGPLESVPVIAKLEAPAHPEFHWKEAAKQNELSWHFIRENYPSVIYWDIYRMTMLRPDRHCQFRNDCLHYCFHSVIDSWVIFLTNMATLFTHESDSFH